MVNQVSGQCFIEQSSFKGQFVYQQAANAKAVFIFAHGAGANMHHEFMEQVSKALHDKAISTLRFNFPYMDKREQDGKRRPPDRMPTLLECYQSVLSSLCLDLPIFIGGKSMGSRVATMVANDNLELIKGVICLGYPFHPPKKPEKLRLEPLQEAKVPLLIIQGERDTLGSKDEISQYSLTTLCDVKYLTDGDHSFKPRVKSGTTLDANIIEAVEAMNRFIDEQ
ncbi:alpha/beta family hydrolase [Thalassotalea sp. PLHSN55]|uniref:alpha/beta family hydrolase n=1 Tax=Thalassotalea sp. PLHSN55 TaxID=3435888 RepID=UPI003F82F8BF